MPTDFVDIVATVQARRQAQSTAIREMQNVRDRYHGDYVIPLPDVEGEPDLPPTAPALIAAAIDSTSQLAASTMPSVWCPHLTDSNLSKKRAETRKRALLANWRFSKFNLLARRAYRHYAAYGTYSFIVVPDFNEKRARIEIRDPLSTYPERRTLDDVRPPSDVAYVMGRSSQWLKSRFGDNETLRRLLDNPMVAEDTLWDTVQWVDDEEIVFGVLGKREPHHGTSPVTSASPSDSGGVELLRTPNRAGMVPVVAPRRITLDRMAGQVSQSVGLFDLMNRLMALDITAAEKAVYPDRYIIGQENRAPQLVSGNWKDGRSGEMNLVLDAQQIGELVSTQGPLVHPVIDRIERAIRITSDISPFFTGETVGSLRTGRAIGELGSMSVDPRVQEMHETMEESLQVVNHGIMAVEKGYWPSKSYSVFAGTRSGRKLVEYTPEDDFETFENAVEYPSPGMDASQLGVILPQRVQAGSMSRRTSMMLDPLVGDAEAEANQVTADQLDQATLQSVLERASSGGMPPQDVARLKQLVRDGTPLEDAVIEVNEEAQERQSQAAPAGSPETQAGIANPGEGAEQPGAVSPGGQLPQGLTRQAQLAQVLGAIRGGSPQ